MPCLETTTTPSPQESESLEGAESSSLKTPEDTEPSSQKTLVTPESVTREDVEGTEPSSKGLTSTNLPKVDKATSTPWYLNISESRRKMLEGNEKC
jgi:hypothetical protein